MWLRAMRRALGRGMSAYYGALPFVNTEKRSAFRRGVGYGNKACAQRAALDVRLMWGRAELRQLAPLPW